MFKTQCIILCGGDNSRWKGYQYARRKHLVEIEGELIINRTLRLVADYQSTDTTVVVNNNDLDLYALKLPVDSELYGIDPFIPDRTEAYKFLSSRELWNKTGRTIVLFGDVWFSEDAIATIFDDSEKDWTAFGRAGASQFTGCPYGELFGHRFTSFDEHAEKLEKLDQMYRDGTCERTGSGWAHYQLMIGKDPNVHTIGSRYKEINDFTEDIDLLSDYDNWMHGRSLYLDRRSANDIAV